MEKVKLYLMDYHKIIDNYELYLNKLTEERKNKALRYVNDSDKYKSILASTMIDKFTLGELKYNEHKKPYKDLKPYFNVSHSKDYVIIGISSFEIGVDIEYIKEFDQKLLNYTLSDIELSHYKEEKDFYLMWTSKESLVKCKGIGLIKNLKTIQALPLNGKKIDEDTFYSKSFIYDNNAVSVTIKSDSDFDIEFKVLDELSI